MCDETAFQALRKASSHVSDTQLHFLYNLLEMLLQLLSVLIERGLDDRGPSLFFLNFGLL